MVHGYGICGQGRQIMGQDAAGPLALYVLREPCVSSITISKVASYRYLDPGKHHVKVEAAPDQILTHLVVWRIRSLKVCCG